MFDVLTATTAFKVLFGMSVRLGTVLNHMGESTQGGSALCTVGKINEPHSKLTMFPCNSKFVISSFIRNFDDNFERLV